MPGLSRPTPAYSAKNMFEGAYLQYTEKWMPFSRALFIAMFVSTSISTIPYFFIKDFDTFIRMSKNQYWLLLYVVSYIVIFIFMWWFFARRDKKLIMNSGKWQKIHLTKVIEECEKFELDLPVQIKQEEEYMQRRVDYLNTELKQAQLKKVETQKLLKTLN